MSLEAGLCACFSPQADPGVPCSTALECPGDQICVCVTEVLPRSDAPLIDAADLTFLPTETLTTSTGQLVIGN